MKGALDGLVQDDRAQGLLVGVAALESADELLAARLERIMTLVKLLAQQPGALVSVDSRTGEISVEGAGERASGTFALDEMCVADTIETDEWRADDEAAVFVSLEA